MVKQVEEPAAAQPAPPADASPTFAELQERCAALERQVEATADVLRLISQSPADLDRTLHVIAEQAATLCHSKDCVILLVEGAAVAGAPVRGVAHFGDLATTSTFGDIRSLDPGRFADRVMLERRTIHVLDGQREDADYPLSAPVARALGLHSTLATPLLRANEPVGVIFVRRAEVRAFSDQQIALLESFANEAVIAIENARQFQEIAQRNRELADALAQQTAIGEILATITRSPTNAQPVFDAIAEQVERLVDGAGAFIYAYDDQGRAIAYAFGPRRGEIVAHQYPALYAQLSRCG